MHMMMFIILMTIGFIAIYKINGSSGKGSNNPYDYSQHMYTPYHYWHNSHSNDCSTGNYDSGGCVDYSGDYSGGCSDYSNN